MASNDPLMQPYRLKHIELRNRLMSTGHEPAYTEDGLPKGRYRLYQEEKAKGGIALTCIGGSSIVAPDSPQAFGNIHLYDDAVVPWLKEMADAVHEHGAAIMCQITHLGRRSSNFTRDWLPLVSASAVREPAHRAFPKAAEDWDLARIAKAYGDGAARCQAADFDGVEIEAYGHFLDSFWSPATNFRDDEYGGPLDNRLRFTFDVIGEIRRQVGPDFLLGFRLVVDEDWERGLTREEGMEIAHRLIATGEVDFLNVIRGHIDTDEGVSHVIPNMGSRSAPHLDFCGEVRAETKFPVFHASRINDVAEARHAIATGRLDMVGMTRAHIADPHIAAKIMRGEEERIRPCVGVGYCIDRIFESEDALCAHNPATGREHSIPQIVPPSDGPKKKVVIVGAGPAGLEAARVCGERGHEVVVFEAADEPGGQVRVCAALPRRREVIGIVDWRSAECERLDVHFRYNTYAEAADVFAEDPDIVIVATGGLPNTSFLDAGEEFATTSWDILTGAVKPGEDVLMYDDNGGHPGMMAAEMIGRSGARLEIVTPERIVAPFVGGTNYPVYFKAFAEAGVTITLNQRLREIRQDGNKLKALFFNEYDKSTHERIVDQVVVEHGTTPLDDIYFELKDGSSNLGEVDYAALLAGQPQNVARNPDGQYALYRIGDAVASRNIHAAIYDAIRLCKDF